MISLRQKLNEYIRIKGTVSYFEIKDKVENGYFGRRYKISNAERRLRESESPDIEAIIQGGHIVSYKHKRPIQFREARVLGDNGEVLKIIKVPIE